MVATMPTGDQDLDHRTASTATGAANRQLTPLTFPQAGTFSAMALAANRLEGLVH